MAFLDVSQVLLDPDLTDTFSVIRRAESIGTNGRSATNESITPTFGVVTAANPDELERLAEMDFHGRAISVVTKYRLRGVTKDYKPDIVVWRGDNYIVRDIDYYPQFGAGFVQALCSSVDPTDVPL